MLSLRSLAFILASARRRARTFSSAAGDRFPDRTNGRKMAISDEMKMDINAAARMCSLLGTVYRV